ncbi:hypothetical protein KC799_24535, partial [candidate division KSB1 bacterium]|nr:hypothetical protein [candidate division KSB1 bacterium]
MEPTTTFFSFVVLKKLADSLGLTDALKDKRKKIAIKVIDHTVPDSIKKALDNFLNSSDVSPLFEKAFASLEMENKQIKRQFVLKMLTDPAISQAIADCEKGQPPQADILTPLFTELLPGRDAQATAEEVVQVFYREFAKNENLIHRLDVTHYFLSTEMDKTTRRIENKIDQLKPAAPVPLYNLPPVQPRFVGREDDLQKLHDFLVTQQGVAQIVGGRTAGVHGMGGLGKSYLAIQFAHQCVQQSEFPGGILFQACSGNSLETIVSEMCEAASVEVHNLPFEKAVQRLKNALASRRLLLILDDVQHDHIETLLPGGQVSVLITSRRRDLPFLVENEVLDLQLFSQTECTDLFRKILGDEVDRHPEEARALFTALGHLPVAIAVAASLLKDSVKWTFASLRAFLSENSGLAELHNSKVNVDKLLTEAITSLPQENQKLLCAMTACAAEGFFFSLACRVAGREAKDLLPGLQLLFNSNLVRELDREQQRYFVHALIRQAAARLPFFAALPEKHARLLRDDFKLWENNWQVLQDFLPEARQATEWVLHSNNSETGYWLLYYAYSLCSRIGRLQEALEFMQEYEKLALQLDDKDSLQISYGNQALI